MKAEVTAFRTVVDVPKWTKPMQKNQRFVLLGSCFAQYMGERFMNESMDALCNPLGAAYNPESIRIQVQQALASPLPSPKGNQQSKAGGRVKEVVKPLPLEEALFHFDGKWRCWWANTLISDTDETRFRETIQNTFSLLGDALREADWLFITLGTNVCYRLKKSGMTVANCHKVPGREFDEVTLNLETCTDTLSNMLELLMEECPKLHVVFTVSPYRYKKYGLHGSQLAKATLLLSVDKVCKRFPNKANYFPAYEIMIDELRDYRFYADDMIHPAPAAVQHIWEKLKI